jgi:hypothetical protein
METKAHWWQNTSDDPYGISVAVYVSLQEQADSLKTVLVRNGRDQRPGDQNA